MPVNCVKKFLLLLAAPSGYQRLNRVIDSLLTSLMAVS